MQSVQKGMCEGQKAEPLAQYWFPPSHQVDIISILRMSENHSLCTQFLKFNKLGGTNLRQRRDPCSDGTAKFVFGQKEWKFSFPNKGRRKGKDKTFVVITDKYKHIDTLRLTGIFSEGSTCKHVGIYLNSRSQSMSPLWKSCLEMAVWSWGTQQVDKILTINIAFTETTWGRSGVGWWRVVVVVRANLCGFVDSSLIVICCYPSRITKFQLYFTPT